MSQQRRKIMLFFCAIMSASFSAGAAELVLKSPARPAGAFVLLGDVADWRGGEEGQWEQLRSVPLLPAPVAGTRRIVRAREIQELLMLQGVDLSGVQLQGANRVEVLSNEAPRSEPAAEPPSTMYVVATRTLNRGDILRLADLTIKPLTTAPRGVTTPLRDLEKSLGMELQRGVAAGQPIDAALLRRPWLVQRNRTVQVIARVGGVQVVTEGRVLMDGAADDVVTIEMLDDRTKRVTGRVTGLDEVEVFARGAAVAPLDRTSASLPQPR